MASADTDREAAEEAAAFRDARVARLTSASGWLTLVGRHLLEPGENPLPFGTVTLDAATGVARVAVTPGQEVTSRGRPWPPPGGPELRSDVDGGTDPIEHAGLVYELVRRGASISLRVRDPATPRRASFPGTEWYPFRPEWKVGATFEPFAEERLIDVPYDFGPVLSRSPGRLLVDAPRAVAGAAQRIDVLTDDEGRRLFVLFRDETNRDETYQAGRFVYTPLPDPATGRVTIDFNQALNPGCVFSEHALCPLPPPGNRFPFRIEAGEKRFRAAPAAAPPVAEGANMRQG